MKTPVPVKVKLAYGIIGTSVLTGLAIITVFLWPLMVAALLVGIIFWATITISDFNYEKKNAKYKRYNNY